MSESCLSAVNSPDFLVCMSEADFVIWRECRAIEFGHDAYL